LILRARHSTFEPDNSYDFGVERARFLDETQVGSLNV
jgi:hypothetical protein